jgi:alkyl sulfatase BDS1-like metallo-beta-lactamase superfamily hydrolase
MILNAEQKGATAFTKKRHDEILEKLQNEQTRIEQEDVEDVRKHLILELGAENLKDDAGNVIWNRAAQTALTNKDYPDTVNPYLWNVYKDGYTAGVLKFADGFYVVIGLDSSPIGFIRSKNGWIIQDCGNTIPAAEISLRLVEKALNENIHDSIKAVIYSHTHTDHMGGAEAFVKAGETPILAPAGFEQSLVDDNLYAGIAMSRRLQYQCGLFLSPDEKGRVSIGLSSTLGVRGRNSSIMPTRLIEKDGEVEIDGVKLTFILTPDTETRAHMCTYFNDYKVLFLGDNSVGTLHNTYTMRGAPVRDANYWGKVFYHLYKLYGDEVEAIYQGHGLPHFKMKHRPDNLKKYLLDNAVSYKYTHDQALLLANEGYSIQEVGSHLKVPESISRTWYTRGHYGEYSFNARGTIQKYLGFYDGNPVHLFSVSERELAGKLISYMGSEEAVLEKAKIDFEKGEYQWVATITSHLVYHNPDNQAARYLCADALEQLGYQTENALWRNAYLAAVLDLRHPEFSKNLNIKAMDNADVIPYVSVELLLDHLGINFDGWQAGNLAERFVLKVNGDDMETEYHAVEIYKGTVLHEKIKETDIEPEEKTISITKAQLYQIATKQHPEENLAEELVRIQNYVVDTSKYKNFSLIEPIEQLRQ